MLDYLDIKTEHLTSFQAVSYLLAKLNWRPNHNGIFIKPNIGATSKFVNTDPNIVVGIIRYLKFKGFTDIIIGEGSVETEYESTPYNFKYCGWYDLAEQEGVKLIDLCRAERVEIPWHYGKLLFPKVMQDRCYINVAKMKTHMQTLVSLCSKNQKGLLDSSSRKLFHKLGLHEPIARLAEVIKPDLCVVDAVTGIEGDGPGDLGEAKDVGLVIAGDNMAEVDGLCCKIMGINPKEVEHLRLMGLKQSKIDVPNFHFKRPSKSFNMFNVYMRPNSGCSACFSGVGKTNKLARKSLRGLWYFFKHGVIRRLDIVVGNPDELPEDHGDVIFYGDCAKQIAEKYPQYPWFKGCPPISKEVLKELVK